jgi:hypothetical protein
MVFIVLNKRGEFPSISSKYVSSSSMFKLNNVVGRGHPCLTPMSKLLHHVSHQILKLLQRQWCTWLLQPIANEVVPLIFGGVPKACHMRLCQKLF